MAKDKDTVTYQFNPPRELWNEWKRTVPRDVSLADRITELLEADRDGRIQPQTRDVNPTLSASTTEEPHLDTPTSTNDGDLLEVMDVPQGKSDADALEAVYAARDYLEEHGPASMREIVTDVMPDYPIGYDVPQLETGDRYRGAWWRRIIQPGLRALPDVEYRKNHGDYRALP